MRQETTISSRWLLSLLLLSSVILSACGDSASVSNANSTSTTAPRPMEVADAKSAANSMAGAPMMDRSSVEDGTAGERYAEINENPFLEARRAPLSTFSIDVDTASYANVRRYLKNGQLPPKDAVRIEELINYFEYDYPQPVGDVPFSVSPKPPFAHGIRNTRSCRSAYRAKKSRSTTHRPLILFFCSTFLDR